MSELNLQGLRKVYRARGQADVEAVRGIDLDVASGELVGLLGPSGCGKSTTLRMIAGLEQVTGGDIRIGGRSVAQLPPQRRNVGIAFENYALYPPLTVRQNIAFGLQARKARGHAAAVADIAERLDITDILDALPVALSSGQKQRVALARAAVRAPDVLLLDEPLSHLDAAQRDVTRRELRRLQKELGYTTILVTHDQEEALSLADRVVVMHQGEVQQVGTPDQIYDDPANQFVADFVGEPAMNLLPAVLETSGQVRLSDTVRVPHPAASGGQDGRAVVLGIRPEDVRARPAAGDQAGGTAGGVSSPEGGVAGVVEVTENLQEQALIHVALDGVEQRLVVQDTPASMPSVGAAVGLTFPPERTYLFDQDTGERIRP